MRAYKSLLIRLETYTNLKEIKEQLEKKYNKKLSLSDVIDILSAFYPK
jgi:hypothetical protein